MSITMKHATFFFLFSFIVKISMYSQTYNTIPNTLASWDCISVDRFVDPSLNKLVRYESYGDSMVNQLNYIKIYKTKRISYTNSPVKPTIIHSDSTKEFYRLIRNTEEGKVIELIGSIEYLLYDFSLNINDSILIPLTEDEYFKIINIDSVLINGEKRKRLEVINSRKGDFDFSSYWIDGIGSVNGLFTNECQKGEFNEFSLGCFKYNSNVYFSQGLYSCNAFTTNIIDNAINDIEIYPMPLIDKIHITFPKLESYRSFKLYDINMIKILQRDILNNYDITLNRDNLKSGIYFIEVIGLNGNRLTKKIIVK